MPDLSPFMAGLDAQTFGLTLLTAFVAGLIKGALGFAMPMVMMSGWIAADALDQDARGSALQQAS